MKFSVAAFSATVATLASGAAAQLTILSPGGSNLWWVAESDNDVTWTCQTSPYTNFTVLIANSDPSVMAAPLAFVAQQPNYDCSELMTKDQVDMPVGTGYVIQLANPFNNTDIYAQSEPFEIKALGSTYPPTSATPTAGGSMTASSTGTATGSAAASTGNTTSTTASGNTSSGTSGLSAPGTLAAAAAAAVFGLIFA